MEYDKEFSALTRKHFDQVQYRLDNMDDIERKAYDKFTGDILKKKHRTYNPNVTLTVENIEYHIIACVEQYEYQKRRSTMREY